MPSSRDRNFLPQHRHSIIDGCLIAEIKTVAWKILSEWYCCFSGSAGVKMICWGNIAFQQSGVEQFQHVCWLRDQKSEITDAALPTSPMTEAAVPRHWGGSSCCIMVKKIDLSSSRLEIQKISTAKSMCYEKSIGLTTENVLYLQKKIHKRFIREHMPGIIKRPLLASEARYHHSKVENAPLALILHPAPERGWNNESPHSI